MTISVWCARCQRRHWVERNVTTPDNAEVDAPMTVPRFFALCAVGAVMWAALVFGLWSFLP